MVERLWLTIESLSNRAERQAEATASARWSHSPPKGLQTPLRGLNEVRRTEIKQAPTTFPTESPFFSEDGVDRRTPEPQIFEDDSGILQISGIGQMSASQLRMAIEQQVVIAGDDQLDGLREQRAELPAPHLSADKVIGQWEQMAERQVAQVREREAQELSRLDKLIAAAKELANEVKERTVAVAQNVAERVEQLRDQYARWRENRVESGDRKPEMQAPAPAQQKAQQRDGPELASGLDIERGRQALRERYEAYQRERQPEAAPEVKPEKDQEQKHEREISRGFGIEM